MHSLTPCEILFWGVIISEKNWWPHNIFWWSKPSRMAQTLCIWKRSCTSLCAWNDYSGNRYCGFAITTSTPIVSSYRIISIILVFILTKMVLVFSRFCKIEVTWLYVSNLAGSQRQNGQITKMFILYLIGVGEVLLILCLYNKPWIILTNFTFVDIDDQIRFVALDRENG